MLLDEPTNHLDVTNVKWLQVRTTCVVALWGNRTLLEPHLVWMLGWLLLVFNATAVVLCDVA